MARFSAFRTAVNYSMCKKIFMQTKCWFTAEHLNTKGAPSCFTKYPNFQTVPSEAFSVKLSSHVILNTCPPPCVLAHVTCALFQQPPPNVTYKVIVDMLLVIWVNFIAFYSLVHWEGRKQVIRYTDIQVVWSRKLCMFCIVLFRRHDGVQ